MLIFEKAESLLAQWKSEFRHGSFAYEDLNVNFRKLVAQHFGDSAGKAYGVYLIRQRKSEIILYIGKGGTIRGDGLFKGQDVPGRLRNVRGDDIGADHWFRELLLEIGPLIVEYLIVETPIAPAYLESTLLQAYLVEHKRLPLKNSAL
ncbi:MAG: hypothetical protein WCG75_00660 [Armatimonadota bacterium]